MDEFTRSLEAFGSWDWACVAANLLAAFAGVYALRCWRDLPGKAANSTLTVGDATLGAGTGLLTFAILFGVVTQLVAQAFSTHFGISQAHVFTAAFCGQLAAAAAMLGMGLIAPKTLDWAPAVEADDPTPAGSPFRQALSACSFPRVLLGLLAIFALSLAATLAWKGLHVAWEHLFLQGWTGQPPADEPQEIVDAVLKTDVDTWRFGTIVLAVAIGAPLMEELAFRGMIYPGLRRVLSDPGHWTRGALWLAILLPITFWLTADVKLDVFDVPAIDPQTLPPADGSAKDARTWHIWLNMIVRLAFSALVASPLAIGLARAATERSGRGIAVVITGALFSAAHQSPSAALPLFAFGAFMCLVRDRHGLLTCMALHGSFNLWNLVWLKLAPNASTL